MSQSNPIIGENPSGLQYRTDDNEAKRALLSHHKGNSAPEYAEAGTIWLDDAVTPWRLKIYDGADWVTIAAVNAASNTVTMFHGTAALRYLNYAADTGAANDYIIAPSPAITAYAAGMVVTLKPQNANTGACTLNVNDLGEKNIKLMEGGDPYAGALQTTGAYYLLYDGTNFVLQNPSADPAAGYQPLNPRVQTVASAANVTPTSANDLVVITAQDESLKINNPTGTMVEGQALIMRIKDDGTARAITWDTAYRAVGVDLPDTTVIGKQLYVAGIWNNTDGTFDVTGVAQEE